MEAGRLVEDLEPAGFGPPAPGAAKATRGGGRTRGAHKRRVEAAEAKLKALQADAGEARERIKGCGARRARPNAPKMRRALEKEEREVERLAEAVEAAKTELKGARSE